MKLLTSSFQKNSFQGHSGSLKVKNTEKSQRGQILNLVENSQITPQNEALDVRSSKKSVSRSLKVIKGQKSQKKVKFLT